MNEQVLEQFVGKRVSAEINDSGNKFVVKGVLYLDHNENDETVSATIDGGKEAICVDSRNIVGIESME
jgi:hypothetical protein